MRGLSRKKEKKHEETMKFIKNRYINIFIYKQQKLKNQHNKKKIWNFPRPAT